MIESAGMKRQIFACVAVFLCIAAGCAQKQKSLLSPSGEMKAVGVASDRPAESGAPLTATKDGMSVEHAVVCTGVVDRIPQGASSSFSHSAGKLYFYTIVRGAARPTTVYHHWLWNGRQVAKIPVKVRSARWRVFSSKKIDPACVGSWQAKAVDTDGNELVTVDFLVE